MGLGTISFAAAASIAFPAATPNLTDAGLITSLCPISLLPAFDKSKLPYVLMFVATEETTAASVTARTEGDRDRNNVSPTKRPFPGSVAAVSGLSTGTSTRHQAMTAAEKAQEQQRDLGIFSNRPPPSWALTPAEKAQNPTPVSSSTFAQADSSSDTHSDSNQEQQQQSDVRSRPYSFFTSCNQPSPTHGVEDGCDNTVTDDLRIGLARNSPLLTVYRPPPTPEMHQVCTAFLL